MIIFISKESNSPDFTVLMTVNIFRKVFILDEDFNSVLNQGLF